jgi:hypothetical protein
MRSNGVIPRIGYAMHAANTLKATPVIAVVSSLVLRTLSGRESHLVIKSPRHGVIEPLWHQRGIPSEREQLILILSQLSRPD